MAWLHSTTLYPSAANAVAAPSNERPDYSYARPFECARRAAASGRDATRQPFPQAGRSAGCHGLQCGDTRPYTPQLLCHPLPDLPPSVANVWAGRGGARVPGRPEKQIGHVCRTGGRRWSRGLRRLARGLLGPRFLVFALGLGSRPTRGLIRPPPCGA